MTALSYAHARSSRISSLAEALVVLLGFSGLYAAFFAGVLLTGRVLAPGDAMIQNFPNLLGPRTLWGPLLFSGFPTLGDPQMMLWYPPSQLLSLLPRSWNVFIVFAYVIASSSLYGYTLRVTGSRLGAAVSGVVLGLSGFLVAHLGHTNMIHAVAWIPLLVWCLEEQRRRPSAGWFCGGAVALGLCGLAGHPQIFANAGLLCLGYVGLLGSQRAGASRGYRPLAIGCVVVGTALAGVLLLPMLELASHSQRATTDYRFFMSGSLRPLEIVQLVLPWVFGGWHGGPFEPTSLPYFGRGNLSEISGYVGLMPLLLAGIAARRGCDDPIIRFWALVAGVALLLALGRHVPLGAVLYLLPGYDQFRIPPRHLLEFTLAIAILSGLGIARLQTMEPLSRRLALRRGTIAIACTVVAAATLATAIFLVGFWEKYRSEVGVDVAQALPWRNPMVLGQLVVSGLGLGVLWLWVRRPTRAFSLVLTGLIVLEVAWFGGFAEWRGSPTSAAFSFPQSLQPYASELRGSHQRLVSAGLPGPKDSAPPNRNRLWGIPSASGYGPLVLARYSEFAGVGPYGLVQLEGLGQDDRSLDLLAVRFLTVPRMMASQLSPGLHRRWQKVGELAESIVFENSQAMPRMWLVGETVEAPVDALLRAIQESVLPDGSAFDPGRVALIEEPLPDAIHCQDTCGTVQVDALEATRLLLRADAESRALLVLSEIFYPGWKARIDGVSVPIHRVDYCLRGIVVPAGSHEVELRFEPWSLRGGAVVSGVGLLTLAGALLAIRRRGPYWSDIADGPTPGLDADR